MQANPPIPITLYYFFPPNHTLSHTHKTLCPGYGYLDANIAMTYMKNDAQGRAGAAGRTSGFTTECYLCALPRSSPPPPPPPWSIDFHSGVGGVHNYINQL